MVSSPGFVSNERHSLALFRLAFAAPGGVAPFGSPRPLTRWLMLQKARRQRTFSKNAASDRLSAHGFRVCFTPLAGVLFTVPSRYCCAIGHPVYLALEGGPPGFPPR
jgi:hypothetical protein